MQKSKIIKLLFVILFIFAPFLALHSQEDNLQQVQENSIKELSEYFRNGKTAIDYTNEQIAKIEKIRNSASEKINEFSDIKMIENILNEAKTDIDKVETSEELQTTKNTISTELEEYFRTGLKSAHTEKQLSAIAEIKEKYQQEIAETKESEIAETILTTAKEEIDKVETAFDLLANIEERLKEFENELEKKQDKEQFIVKELFSLIAIFLVLLVITFIIVTYFIFKKYKTTILNKLKKPIEDSINDLRNSFEKSHKEINARIQNLNYDISNINARSSIDHRINKPMEDVPKPIDLQKTVAPPQKPEEIIPEDPIEDFNNWAADPSRPLPNRFYYVKGEIKLRAEQSFAESYSPTEWICNKRTDKHYLLPNPNFFEELTNIKSFYKMDIEQLKPRGRNKIKVIEPCKMSNKGWIDNPGELEFK